MRDGFRHDPARMSRYRLKSEDLRLWSLVTATVRPHKPPAKAEPAAPEIETLALPGMPPDKSVMRAQKPKPAPLTPFRIGEAVRPPSGFRLTRAGVIAPDPIEPKRKRRISRERDPIEARLDLHGLNAIAAEARLKAFVQQAFANDYRAVLVITGKGVAETGLLKRMAPEWLADPALSHIVAGLSPAHARHGGAGALYVALKRRNG
jgi:DNA-nicking Smr family endonuclease